MAFALWIEPELAWAAGTHEYRPMGVAVLSNTDLFRPRDFRSDRKAPSLEAPAFVGYFASLGDVNDYMERRSRRANAKEPASAERPRGQSI